MEKKMIQISDFMPNFKKLTETLDIHNLVIVIGEKGTGKTGFVNNYIKYKQNLYKQNLYKQNLYIKRANSDTPKHIIFNFFRLNDILNGRKVLIYDDNSIKMNTLKEVSKLVKFNTNKQFIVIVNKIGNTSNLFKKIPPKNYVIHHTEYPTKHELVNYMDNIQSPIEKELRTKIFRLKPLSMRRIQYTIDDGYYSGEEIKPKDKFDITTSSYLLSFAIAENLPNLKKLKENIIDADKLKNINDYFYKDFIELFYKNISKKRLRHPKKLLKIKKDEKKK